MEWREPDNRPGIFWYCWGCGSFGEGPMPKCPTCNTSESEPDEDGVKAFLSRKHKREKKEYQQRIYDTKAVLDFLAGVFKDQKKVIIAEPTNREVRKP